MEIVIPIIAAVAGVLLGAGGIFAYNKKNEKGGKDKADDLVRKAKREASDIVLSAKRKRRRLRRRVRQRKMSGAKSGARRRIVSRSGRGHWMRNWTN